MMQTREFRRNSEVTYLTHLNELMNESQSKGKYILVKGYDLLRTKKRKLCMYYCKINEVSFEQA